MTTTTTITTMTTMTMTQVEIHFVFKHGNYIQEEDISDDYALQESANQIDLEGSDKVAEEKYVILNQGLKPQLIQKINGQ